MNTAKAKSKRVDSASLKKSTLTFDFQKGREFSYHPAGKLNVMLSFDAAPYFRYPKNPTKAYINVTMDIPMFKTPNFFPKSFGVPILFSSAITTPTASRANKTVPKYRGNLSIGPKAGIESKFGRSWNT